MNRPKIILDYGVNAEGDIEKAIEAIEIAHSAGVDAIKFQHYNPKEQGKPDNYKLSFDEYRMIANKCEALQLEWGISLFDSTWDDVHIFQDLGVGFFKIAACQNSKISHISSLLGKLSTDIWASINCYDQVSMYLSTKINFRNYLFCKNEYPCFNPPLKLVSESGFGYSCHTPMYHACLAAQMLGAPVIEKHFTLAHNQSDFRDHKHALNPTELNEWMYWVDYYAKGGKG